MFFSRLGEISTRNWFSEQLILFSLNSVGMLDDGQLFWSLRVVLRLSGYLYLLSCAVSVAGLTHYSAVCRHRLKVSQHHCELGLKPFQALTCFNFQP